MKRIMLLLLIVVFLSQQVALAEVIDLRDEGQITTTEGLVSVITGYTSGRAIPAGASTFQVFAYTYLIPQAVHNIVAKMDIKNSKKRFAIEMALSMALTAAMDAKVASTQAIKKKAEETIAKQSASDSAKSAFQKIGESITDGRRRLESQLKDSKERQLNKALLRKAAKKAITKSLLASGTEALYERLKERGMNKAIARFWANEAGEILGYYTGRALGEQSGNFSATFTAGFVSSAIQAAAAKAGKEEYGVLVGSLVSAPLQDKAMTNKEALLKGLEAGLLAVGLQAASKDISNKMGSDEYGAVSSVILSSIIKDKGKIRVHSIDAAMTEGLANWYGGAPGVIVNKEGELVPDPEQLKSRTSNPVFISRYRDYIRDLDKYGYNYAITNQFISALHYQAVVNLMRPKINYSGVNKQKPTKKGSAVKIELKEGSLQKKDGAVKIELKEGSPK